MEEKFVKVKNLVWKWGTSMLAAISEAVLVLLLVANAVPEFYYIFDLYKTKAFSGIYTSEEEVWQFDRDNLIIYNNFGVPMYIWKFSVFMGEIKCENVVSVEEMDNTPGSYLPIKYKKDGKKLYLTMPNGNVMELTKVDSTEVIFGQIKS